MASASFPGAGVLPVIRKVLTASQLLRQAPPSALGARGAAEPGAAQRGEGWVPKAVY